MNKMWNVIFVVGVICMEAIIMVILRATNKDWAITIHLMIAYAVIEVILYLVYKRFFL